jgi:TonB-dependent receptor
MPLQPIVPTLSKRKPVSSRMPRFRRKALTAAILSVIAGDVLAAESQPVAPQPAVNQPAATKPVAAQRGAELIDEMVVYGRAIETGQLRAINDQLEAKAVATIISKELFGQVNDGNIATSMQRMPGLSADGNGGDEIPRYINIRGISAAYNSVQVDGARMPASGTGRGADYGNTGRGFALDDLPSDAIEKVEIVKQPTPDMDADGLGGAVNLVTKSALDYEQRVVSFNVGGNYNALRDDVFPNGAGTYIESFDFEGGQRLGVQLTASYYETNEGFDNRDIDYNPLITAAPVNDYLNLQAALDASGRTQTALGDDEERLQNVFYQEDTELNTFVIDRERFGFSGNFDLALDDRTSLFLKTLYNTEEQDTDDRRNHRIMDNDHNGSCNATFNPANPQACFLSRRIIPGNAPGPQVRLGSDPQRRSTIDFVTTETGRATLDANGVPRGQMRYVGNETETEIELFSLSFGGSHRFERATLSASGNVASTENQFDQLAASFLRRGFAYEYDQTNAFRGKNADYRILNNEFSYLDDVDPNEVVVNAARRDTIRPNIFEVREGDASEDRMQFKVDYEHELPEMEFVSGTWKVGVKYQNMERSYDYDEVQYNLAAPGTPGYTLVPWADLVRQNEYKQVDDYDMPFSPNPSALLAFVNNPANATNGTFVNNLAGAFDDGLQEDYDYEEEVYAAYGMVSVEAGPFELIAGARWEYTDQSVDRVQFDFDENGLQETDVSNVTDERDYSVLLPSAILKWKITDELVMRFAVSETFARPQLLDLINTRRVNEQGNPVEIETGNFDLPPLRADNIDLVLEYYTEDGLWSAGLFRKDLRGFSFPALEILDNVAEFDGRDLVITTPLATGTARNQGIELSVFQRMSMLPAPWNGIFVNANYTYTDSQAEYPGRESEELPTQGSSRHLAFASLGYEWRGLSMEIQYRYRSAFIEGLAFVDAQGLNSFVEDDVFGDTQTFNALFSYQVLDNVTVYVNGTNIFNEQNASRQGYKRYPEDVYYNERRIQFGVKGQF